MIVVYDEPSGGFVAWATLCDDHQQYSGVGLGKNDCMPSIDENCMPCIDKSWVLGIASQETCNRMLWSLLTIAVRLRGSERILG